jgi:ATP-binding cassette subfamily F protein 3
MVGTNGIGKTTLLKIILGQLPPSGGQLRRGTGVRLGYYDQEQQSLGSGRSVLEEMTDSFRAYSEGEMRGLLGRFLFRGDAVFRDVSALSGGERARLSLLKLLLSGANTLLLDEPTNHLDIPAREAVEDALLDFPGTLLVVSHDRYFLNKIPTAIAELTPGGLVRYPGNYDYFNAKKTGVEARSGRGGRTAASVGRAPGGTRADEAQADEAQTNEAWACEKESGGFEKTVTGKSVSNSAAERLRKKQTETERLRREKKLASLEQNIAALEGELAETERELMLEEVYSNAKLLTEKAVRIEALKSAINESYTEFIALEESIDVVE